MKCIKARIDGRIGTIVSQTGPYITIKTDKDRDILTGYGKEVQPVFPKLAFDLQSNQWFTIASIEYTTDHQIHALTIRSLDPTYPNVVQVFQDCAQRYQIINNPIEYA